MDKKPTALNDESLQPVSGGLNGHVLTRVVRSLIGSIFASQSSTGKNNGQDSEKPPAK